MRPPSCSIAAERDKGLHQQHTFAVVSAPLLFGILSVTTRLNPIYSSAIALVAGATALRLALDEEFASSSRTLLVGFLQEKEPHEMLTALGLDDTELLVCCRPPSPRAVDPAIVAKAAEDLGFPPDRIDIHETVRDAIGAALLATPDDGQLVITGSLYTVGAARSVLVPGG